MSQLATVYNEAYKYLETYLDNLNLAETSKEIIEAEFAPYRTNNKPKNLTGVNGVYYKMLVSLMNKQGFPSFIGWESVLGMADILFNYDAKKVYETYGHNFESLFRKFEQRFPNKSFDISKPRSAWYQYTTGVISCAKILSNFANFQEFDEFVESFNFNEYAVIALPLLLDREISGYGFALSCDFLKESGYSSYGKPDVHLMDIFFGVSIIEEKSELETFKIIVKMAREVGEPPVIVDKLFWTIGSGLFNEYNKIHAQKIPVHRLKDDFIMKFDTGLIRT